MGYKKWPLPLAVPLEECLVACQEECPVAGCPVACQEECQEGCLVECLEGMVVLLPVVRRPLPLLILMMVPTLTMSINSVMILVCAVLGVPVVVVEQSRYVHEHL